MTETQARYIAINAVMCGLDIERAPADVVEVVKDDVGSKWDKLVERVSGLGKISVPELSEVCQTFLNYLRAPDCALCVASGSGRVLTVNQVATKVRAEDIPVGEVNSWASGSIVAVEYCNCIMPEVRDGVLLLPNKYYGTGCDLVGEMNRAFALYCWGVENPTEQQKAVVSWCENFVSPVGDLSMKVSALADFVAACEEAKYNPMWAVRGPLLCSDLSLTSKVSGVPSWWADISHTAVSVILPRGRTTKLAHARLPVTEFTTLYTEGKLPALFVSGDRITVG